MRLLYVQKLAEWGVSLDTETFPITDACRVPRLVCGSVAVLDLEALVAGADRDLALPARLLYPEDVAAEFLRALEDPQVILVGANLAFDLPVIVRYYAEQGRDVFPQVFAALEEGRVYDLQLAEALNAIAQGHLGIDPRTGRPLVNPETGRRGMYSLSMCVSLCLGRDDAKENDEFRERYGEFHNVPHEQWPEKARQYPRDDAQNTHEVALAQTGHLPKTTDRHQWREDGTCGECGATTFGESCVTTARHRNLCNLREQVYAAFALALGASWGFRVDQSKVDAIEDYARKRHSASIGPFLEAGIVRQDGTENRSVLKAKIARAYGSTKECGVCGGRGRIPAPNQRRRTCPSCRGRCVPKKHGAKILPPTVLHCPACSSTGKVPDPGHLVGCCGEGDEKTCDGTGLELAASAPRSESGEIAYGGDALHESGDDLLMAYGDYGEDKKWLTAYVPYLRLARIPVAGHTPECVARRSKKGQRRPPCDCEGPYRSIPLTLHPDPVKETARVSYKGYIQQFPRWAGFKEKDRETGQYTGRYIPSFRECIVPDPGWFYSSEDFKAGELVTHAESCHILCGFSDLGDVLLSVDKNGEPMDPHSDLAAFCLGISYEEFTARKKEKKFADCRQAQKPQNFGKPTGMGSPKMVIQQRMQGEDTPHPTGPSMVDDGNGNLVPGYKGMRYCILMGGDGPCGGPGKTVMWWKDRPVKPMCRECLERCDELGEVWKRKWRENKKYARHVSNCVERGQVITWDLLRRWPWLQEWYAEGTQLAPGEIMSHYTGRIRGGLTFTECSNSYFQSLLADITKAAYCQVTRECYDRAYRVPSMLFDNSIPSRYAGGQSPLFGSRAPGFFHDEIFAAHPGDTASDAPWRISEVMRDWMRNVCRRHADAAIVEPALMSCWNKAAVKVIHGGKLVPWEPGHDPKKCQECNKA